MRSSSNFGHSPVQSIMRGDRSSFAGERKERRRTTEGTNPIKVFFSYAILNIGQVNERVTYESVVRQPASGRYSDNAAEFIIIIIPIISSVQHSTEMYDRNL